MKLTQLMSFIKTNMAPEVFFNEIDTTDIWINRE